MSATAFSSLTIVLDELAHVVDRLSDQEFSGSAVAGVSGSVGGHVRHCLDHVRAFETGLAGRTIDYDTRERDTIVETDRTLAWSALVSSSRRLSAHSDTRLAQPVVVRTRLDAVNAPREVASSIGRELSFVIAHTIHHDAMIALLVERHEGRASPGRHHLPEGFGFAPSTLADRDEPLTCAL